MIAVRIRRHVQFWPGPHLALNVMPSGHAISVQILGGGQKILELHPLIAADAGHRGRPGQIGIGEFFDHRLAEGVFVVQHVMRKAHGLGHPRRIMNVAPRTAGALFGQGRAVVVKLQGDAHDVIALVLQHGRHDRRIHASRHGHHHAGFRRRFGQAKRVEPLVKHGVHFRGVGADQGRAAEQRRMLRNIGKCCAVSTPGFTIA